MLLPLLALVPPVSSQHDQQFIFNFFSTGGCAEDTRNSGFEKSRVKSSFLASSSVAAGTLHSLTSICDLKQEKYKY
jgi:hypothetical protein